MVANFTVPRRDLLKAQGVKALQQMNSDTSYLRAGGKGKGIPNFLDHLISEADTGALTDEENEASGEENLPSVGSEDESDEDEEEETDTGALTDEENEASGEENLPSVGSEDESDEDEEEQSEEDSDDDEERLARGHF
ncbi:unnamed protein product [Toxocara canis]|uniref:Prothymosin alpha n=1 Tax=Toxocara canis TaxID=6265 RepID=A0A183V5T0_TOXCA|nr:unnamed protein product [Toxocara canis]